MLSRKEVAEVEQYDTQEELEKNQKLYCGDSLKQIEVLQNLVAFYQGEGIAHAVELEYRELANILPSKRSEAQVKRLVQLANVLSNAADTREKIFYAELEKYSCNSSEHVV